MVVPMLMETAYLLTYKAIRLTLQEQDLPSFHQQVHLPIPMTVLKPLQTVSPIELMTEHSMDLLLP